MEGDMVVMFVAMVVDNGEGCIKMNHGHCPQFMVSASKVCLLLDMDRGHDWRRKSCGVLSEAGDVPVRNSKGCVKCQGHLVL